MAKYSKTSPYFNTTQTSWYLNNWASIEIPALDDDSEIILGSAFNKRPDLLSYKLYNRADLWWVFAVRNPDVIKDPIYDMKAGITIFAPSLSDLTDILNA